MRNSIGWIAIIALAVGFLGCAKAPVVFVEGPASTSFVTGTWVGTWSAAGAGEAGMPLTVTCLESKPGVWLARFDAVCGRDASFTFDIEGREENGIVIFDQAVDLGPENGGEYHWRGEVSRKEFRGEYKSRGYSGGFLLKKQSGLEGASLLFCPDPNRLTRDVGLDSLSLGSGQFHAARSPSKSRV